MFTRNGYKRGHTKLNTFGVLAKPILSKKYICMHTTVWSLEINIKYSVIKYLEFCYNKNSFIFHALLLFFFPMVLIPTHWCCCPKGLSKIATNYRTKLGLTLGPGAWGGRDQIGTEAESMLKNRWNFRFAKFCVIGLSA